MAITDSKRIIALQEDMDAAVSAYVKGYNSHKLKKSELKTLKSAVKTAVDSYNLALSKETYRAWAAEGDPVKTALRVRKIPHAQKVSLKADDEDVMSSKFSDTDYYINLPMMQATLGADVFSDPTWFNKLEKLSYIIANRINLEIGGKAGFDYQIADASKAFNFPEDINIYSIEGVAYALQQVFDAICFVEAEDGGNVIRATLKTLIDGTKTCEAWKYIRETMTREGEADGEILIANTGKMSHLVGGAMHVLLTNGDFVAKADGSFVMPKDDADTSGENESASCEEEEK